jgi:hypothetical protein
MGRTVVASAFSGSFLPQEHNNKTKRLVRKTVLKGFKSISKLFLVCIRIPGESLKERFCRIMIRRIAVNGFCYFAMLPVLHLVLNFE